MSTTVTEEENGWYNFTWTTSHSNTLGFTELTFRATGVKNVNLRYDVVLRTRDEIAADIERVRKIMEGRWKIDSDLKKLYFYDESGPTVLATFDLKDENGNPTATRIFERTPA